MKKELYLGGEKPGKDYHPKGFAVYFRQLFKKLIKVIGRK